MPVDRVSIRNVTTLDQAWNRGRNNFNLMRLFAAWMVIYGHAWAITGSPGGDLVAQLTQYRYAGAVAVDTFFVISGFLIAASLQRRGVRAYLIARALRIVPALLACTVLTAFVIGPLVTNAPDYLRTLQPWRYVAINSSLWKSQFLLPGVFDQLPQHVANGSLWTLPVEAKLYVVLLGISLVGLLTPRRFTPLFALVVGIGYALAIRHAPLPGYLRELAWCVGFFMAGTLMWVNRRCLPLHWALLLGLVVACAWTRGSPWFHLPYCLTLAYGTVFIAFLPRLPVIRHTDLSYGIYLYGWPVAQLVQEFSPGGPLHNAAWTTLLVLPLAAGSWWLVERPALALKKRFAIRAPQVVSPVSA
jgi:peptidoglycan/LPS O-acetylase OafA/YrhL